MACRRFGCVICGCQVDDHYRHHVGWWMEFRISSFITGVGRRNDPDSEIFRAPSDPLKRWDNDDWVPQPDEIIPVMRQSARDGVHGFIIHETCWNLLREFFKSREVPLHRFVEICESLPFPWCSINVSWDNTYNGLCEIEDHRYPWYGDLSDPDYGFEVKEHACYDPFNVPEVAWILESSMLESSPFTPFVLIEERPSKDCFWKLPWELREMLAIYLPTGDALNLRHASGAFIPLLNSQTFWASRFRPGDDREVFLEAQAQDCHEPRDWLKLYRITRSSQCPPGLQNRQRIWPLLQHFSQLLSSLQPNNALSTHRKVLNTQESNWVSVTGEIEQEPVPLEYLCFEFGCRLYRTDRALIPRGITRVAISSVGSDKYGYITGISFISASGEVVRLGYTSKGNETFVEVSQLTGFTLAMAPGGLKGLKIIDNSLASQWVGFPLDCPITERLATFQSIEAVEIGIDGYKIVTFAAAGPRINLPVQFVNPRLLLHSSFLWYPSVPRPELYLNKMSMAGAYPQSPQYQASIWVSFGGLNGADLQHLTEIRLISTWHLDSIEFHYNQAEHPIETVKLNTHNMAPFPHLLRLSIDGRGAEYIQKISQAPNTQRICQWMSVTELSVSTQSRSQRIVEDLYNMNQIPHGSTVPPR